MSEPRTAPQASGADALRGKVWVTREAVQVDRIASAWLIRRFIDPGARFKFVPGRAYLPRTGEVRFDMFEGEYTHEGDRCTFEVLLQRAGLHDAALARHRRDHPRHRPQGRQVRPRGDRRHPHRHSGHRQRPARRRGAAGARRRGAGRSLPVAPRIDRGEGKMTDVPLNRAADVPGHGVPFGEAMKVWARVAALSFGGPAGQIAVMHRIIVEEKKWIGDQRFLQALNYCTLLPGPEAQQLATYIGWLMHKTKGGLLAGTLFVLPGLLAIMALSWIYVLLGKVTVVQGLFFGLKAAVLVIVIEAVLRVGRRALEEQHHAGTGGRRLHRPLLLRRAVPGDHRARGADRLCRRPRQRARLRGRRRPRQAGRQAGGRLRVAARRGDARTRPPQRALVAFHHSGVPGALAGAGRASVVRPGQRQCLHPDRHLLQQDGRRHLRRRLCRAGLRRPAGGRQLPLGDGGRDAGRARHGRDDARPPDHGDAVRGLPRRLARPRRPAAPACGDAWAACSPPG